LDSNAGTNFFSALAAGDRASAEDTGASTRSRLWNRYLNSIQPSSGSGVANQDILTSADIIQQQGNATGAIPRSHYDDDEESFGITSDFQDWHLFSVPSESLLFKRAQVEQSDISMDTSLNIDQTYYLLNQIESLERRIHELSSAGSDSFESESISRELNETVEAISVIFEELKSVYRGKRAKTSGTETILAEQISILEKQLFGSISLSQRNSTQISSMEVQSYNEKNLEDRAMLIESQLQTNLMNSNSATTRSSRYNNSSSSSQLYQYHYGTQSIPMYKI
jgi:hypothetical protein